jgi:hypothetical protein
MTDLESRLRTSKPNPPDPPDEFVGSVKRALSAPSSESGGPAHARRRTMLAIAVSLIAAFAVGYFAAPSSGGESGQTVALQTLNAAYGVSVDLPSGWTGRIYNEQPAESPKVYLQFANFALPDLDDDLATNAARVMPSDGVIASLFEVDSTGGPPVTDMSDGVRLSERDFGGSIEGVAPDHAVARVFLQTEHRTFMLLAQFGERPVPPDVLEELNAVLATLDVKPT